MTSTYIKRGGILFYGLNKTYKVFDKYDDLTKAFKKRFRRGEIKKLPKGYLYSTITNRFYDKNRKNKKRFRNLNDNDGILTPNNIYDYNIEKLDYRTILRATTNENTFGGWTGSLTFSNESNIIGLNSLKSIVVRLLPIIKQIIRKNGNIKYYITVYGLFTNAGDERENILQIKDNKSKTLYRTSNVIQSLKEFIREIEDAIEDWEGQGSGWKFEKVSKFTLHYTKYRPLRASSYIETPQKILNTKSCINPQNKTDNECFKWCLGIHNALLEGKTSNLKRTNNIKPYTDKLDFKGIEFPFIVNSKNIKMVEDLNDLSISVFWLDDDNKISPLYVSDNYVNSINNQVKLLLIIDEDNYEKKHFIYIKDFSKLLGSQYNNHKEKIHFCHYCLHGFSKEEILQKHINDGCSLFGIQKTILPKKGENILKFKNYNKKFPVPFVIYGDFECSVGNKHKLTGFTIYAVCSVDDSIKFKPILYSINDDNNNDEKNNDVMSKFYIELEKVRHKILLLSQRCKDTMKITIKELKCFKKAKKCHICEIKFEIDDILVKDHCHITGKYMGASHQKCNINRNDKHLKIPVFFHNCKGYDSHFIIKEFSKKQHSYINKKNKEIVSKIDVVAANSEKFITFSYNKMQFLDTFAFMSSGLDKLVELKKYSYGEDSFIHTKRHIEENLFKLSTRKGVYPYEYVDNASKLKDKCLPSIDKFYSKLTETGISEDDYKHALNVWKVGKFDDMQDYHDHYLKTDVLLLADVFENFRKVCLSKYGLDPARYWTLPSYSWDCMMKMTKVNLELLTDIEMYNFCEKGIRGGVSIITHRHAKANNKYCNGYDENLPNSYIMYLDANNLYGTAMSDYLPYGEFKWVEHENFNIKTMNDDDNVGYFLEVDLEYPKELHNLHNDLPVAPESINIKNNECFCVSDYQTELKKELNILNSNTKKLIPNLNDKVKYVLHSKNLEYYLNLGLKLQKVHRVLKFNQKKWLKPYIDFNTIQRTECSKNNDKFGKNLYKSMNNIVFGKTMENVRNRIDFELVDDLDRMKKITSCPRYKTHKTIRCESDEDEGLNGVLRNKNIIILDKPIYVGLTILDLSKITMYKFHYGYIKQKYGENAKLLFTDTDSLCYHINTDDFYKDMEKDKEKYYDLSNYDKEHFLYDNINESQLGFFKDEMKGIPIIEFCGIRSKMYSILLDNGDEPKTAKGIKKCAINRISHNDYKRCLFGDELEDKKQKISFYSIRSKNHEVGTMEINKTSLCSYDDKRYYINNISSYSYGHYKIKS